MFWIDSVWRGTPVGGKEGLEDSYLFFPPYQWEVVPEGWDLVLHCLQQPAELVQTREEGDLQEELQLDLGKSSAELVWKMGLCSGSIGIRKELQMPALVGLQSHADCCRPIFLMCFFFPFKLKKKKIEKLLPWNGNPGVPKKLLRGFSVLLKQTHNSPCKA